jgi:hypothetical protein
MNAWSNIEVSPQDSEIKALNTFEKTLGEIPVKIRQIRELITRFEVCHFKYQLHLRKIKDSVTNLESVVNPDNIGQHHIQKGENAWEKDKTGRSLIGQQYLWSLINWLGDDPEVTKKDNYKKDLSQKIKKWLGDKNPDKERLVRLLVARLTWNWQSYEKLQSGGQYKELESQACRMDICHYAFPQHLNSLLQAMGVMKPVKNFAGCGTFNEEIKKYIEEEFSELHTKLKSKTLSDNNTLSQNELKKIWLLACLAKTLKEQIGLTKPLSVYFQNK